MGTETMHKTHTPWWQGCPHSRTSLDWLQLALGELPVLACTALGFWECGFVLSPPGPLWWSCLCSGRCCSHLPRDHRADCRQPQVSLGSKWSPNKRPVKSGYSWKRLFSLLRVLVKWCLFLDRLQTLKTVVATFKNSPEVRLNCSLTSSKLELLFLDQKKANI